MFILSLALSKRGRSWGAHGPLSAHLVMVRYLAKGVLQASEASLIRNGMSKPTIGRRLAGLPAHLLMLGGLGFLWACTRLPFKWQLALGCVLGRLVFRLYPYRKDVALTNLRLCFPQMPEAEREALAKRHYEAMGIGLFELGMAWWGRSEKLKGRINIRGLEHVQRLREEGRGALLLTAHFTTLEIIGRLVNDYHKFSCLYRRPDNPTVAKYMTRSRQRQMERIIHFDDMVGLIRALKAGDHVWYAPDQGKLFKYTALLPFFGEPAVTNTATGRIAKMAGAVIVPFFGRREVDGSYTVDIYPPMENVPSGDSEADAIAINHVLEGFIETAPEQYFWLHRRFKRRGAGLPDVYAKSDQP